MGIAVEAVERPGEGSVWRWWPVNEKSRRRRLRHSYGSFGLHYCQCSAIVRKWVAR